MPEKRSKPASDSTHSELSGNAGDVVQARDISGGVHFHYGIGSQGAPPQQLPRGIRIFINRTADLRQLDDLLAARRDDGDGVAVCVIAGTAGVGKTSLALRWAHQVRDQFPAGQLYVDLRGYDPGPPVSAEETLERFLTALGVPATAIPHDLGSRASLYRSLLADRQMLIILDNAGSAGQVRPLIPGTSRSMVIVTSRSRLSGLVIRDGAHRTTLDTLTEAESVDLLTATTSVYRSGDRIEDIAELARLCARLPLALRIAAERAASRPSMPLSELIADLRNESELWSALSTEDEDEASAVRSVFAWSYRALPSDAARLFCFLGLHPGGEFSQAAAAALADNARHVRSSLDVLVGACMLENSGFNRYQFHDLLRAYAVDLARYEVPQEEQLGAVERICTWYLHTAYQCALSLAHDTTLLFPVEPVLGIEPLSFTDRAAAARWYEEEKANLVGAVRAARETRLLSLSWRLAVVLERIYATYNHVQDWRTTSLLGLQAAQDLGLRENEAVMCESLGRLCRMTLQLDEAAEYHRRAVAIHREHGDPLSVVKALNGLGWVHLFAHRLDEARSALDDALSTVRSLDDVYWTATVLYSLGYVHLQLEQPADAEAHLTEALASFRALDDTLYVSMVLTAVSLLHRGRGEPVEALTTAQRAVDLAHDMANDLWEGTALLYLGKAQRAAGRADEALVSYQRAAVIFRREGDLSREAMALNGTGRAYSELGRAADAVGFHLHAASVQRQLGDRWKLAKTLAHLADTLNADRVEAARYRAEALTILGDYTDSKSVALRASLRRSE